MIVLLDECVPKALSAAIVGHSTSTVVQQGWSGKKNGELLTLMASAGFEVLLTVDQGVQYQQNLNTTKVSIIVLVASSNDIDDLLPLIPKTLTALGSVQPGDVVEIRA